MAVFKHEILVWTHLRSIVFKHENIVWTHLSNACMRKHNTKLTARLDLILVTFKCRGMGFLGNQWLFRSYVTLLISAWYKCSASIKIATSLYFQRCGFKFMVLF
jgi:hypothetical protein